MINYKNHFMTWWSILESSPCHSELDKIIPIISEEYSSKIIFPEKFKIFRAFREISVNNCQYILLGMDPYINIYKDAPSACGLSFVTENGYINPSLRILCKSLDIELNGISFRNYAFSKNMLLLNSALTVEKGKSGSHIKIWENFTKELCSLLSKKLPHITWILLGKDAQKFKKYISHNNVLEGPHPASYVYKGSSDYSELKNLFKLVK